jgi:NTP pyrophosphatase (non-canonical NTP hydrolase)
LFRGAVDNLRAIAISPLTDTPGLYLTEWIEALRTMQAIAGSVYGRLEPERALAWTVEELGEVAQARRRREGKLTLPRMGQPFSWVLCLSNICEVDIGHSADLALRNGYYVSSRSTAG